MTDAGPLMPETPKAPGAPVGPAVPRRVVFPETSDVVTRSLTPRIDTVAGAARLAKVKALLDRTYTEAAEALGSPPDMLLVSPAALYAAMGFEPPVVEVPEAVPDTTSVLDVNLDGEMHWYRGPEDGSDEPQAEQSDGSA